MGMSVKGVLLCGGEGKRLRPLTYYFQKTMIPVGSKQKPLLEYIVKLFRHHGIRDLVLLVGYKNEQIKNYFEDGSRFDVSLEYVEDLPGVKGTGNALYNAYKLGVFNNVDNLMIYYGDIIADLDLKDMLEKHVSRRAYATLAVATKYQVPVGVVEAEGEKIIKMVEKPWLDLNVTIGILALSTRVLPLLDELREEYREMDIMGHVIPRLLEKNYPVYMYPHNGFWYDVGSTEKYEKLDNHFVDEIFNGIL
jgi:mannose-1-phosphate guanylyltransferase